MTNTDYHPQHAAVALLAVDKAVIETAIMKVIARQIMTAAAEVAVVVGITIVNLAIVMVKKVEKLLWKAYRWIWLKKTFDNSFSPPFVTSPDLLQSAKHFR